MRRMSWDWESLWRALSTPARVPRSRKSTGVHTGNGFRARIRPRCGLACPIFALHIEDKSVQIVVTLFGQICGRNASSCDRNALAIPEDGYRSRYTLHLPSINAGSEMNYRFAGVFHASAAATRRSRRLPLWCCGLQLRAESRVPAPEHLVQFVVEDLRSGL